MDKKTFQALMMPVMTCISGQVIDQRLAVLLTREFPVGGDFYQSVRQACQAAIAAGWMCAHGEPGGRYGRVIKATPDSLDLSIDVVQLRDYVGPHHRHPTGEICLTMPLTATALFDGQGAGWCVNDPGSAHQPTVSGGEALVLYLLPGGEIEFTR